MSDATTIRTLTAVPDPEPQTGLTGTPAAIYTELLASPNTTVAELALAAGIGRSTAGKALATLEEHGLAVREEGERTGARRTPDRWRCTPPTPTTDNNIPNSDEPEATVPADTTAHAPTTPAPEKKTADPSQEPKAIPSIDDEANTPTESAEAPDGDDASTSDAAAEEGAATNQPEPPVTPVSAPTPAAGGKVRLAPGALRQLVIDHLTAHPTEAFTATAISRKIEKSSGAIANALLTLAKQNIAEQVTDQPRRYRLVSNTSTE